VAESYLRRHVDHRWPAHTENCDFYRDATEQRRITASYRLLAADAPFQLVQGFRKVEDAQVASAVRAHYEQERPPLARLLVRLVTDAKLQTVEVSSGVPIPAPQYAALRSAAALIRLGREAILKDYLETFSGNIDRFLTRIGKAPADLFRPCRPHGVLLAVAKSIGGGEIMLRDDTKLPVRGRLAIFGELEGHRRSRADEAARPPYLVAALVARRESTGPVEILKAYAHPVASAARLMLVDSDFERATLERLIEVQRWFFKKHAIAVSIEKPLFDIGPEIDVCDEATFSRPPCIPDFIIKARSPAGAVSTVIVETMGFADEGYRARKVRVHEQMSLELAGAAVVTHDFHYPKTKTQAERNNFMGRATIKNLFDGLSTRQDRIEVCDHDSSVELD
jgi:hypothetical protein